VSSTIDLTPEAEQYNKDFAEGVLGVVHLARALGIKPPTASEIVEDTLSKTGRDYVLHPLELRFLYKISEGDIGDVVAAVPAENVPAEISGAWYEVRAAGSLMEQIEDFLKDPDDEPEAEADPLDELRKVLAGV
jgi:hypothetical protein